MIQDYGFRLYNPSIGRFLSVDPLTESYPWYTPYQFSGNKPTRFIDLDGLEEFDPFFTIKYNAGVAKGFAKGGFDLIKFGLETNNITLGIRMFKGLVVKDEKVVAEEQAKADMVYAVVTSGEVRKTMASAIGQSLKKFGKDAVGMNGPFEMGEAHGLILFEIAGMLVGAGEAKQLANLTKLLKAGDVKGVSQLVKQTLKAHKDNLSEGLKKHIDINCLNCFTAGTLILTAQGAKVIEDIEVGDMVWSYDEETGDVDK